MKMRPSARDSRAFPQGEDLPFWALAGSCVPSAVSLATLSARPPVFSAIAGPAADVAARLADSWPHPPFAAQALRGPAPAAAGLFAGPLPASRGADPALAGAAFPIARLRAVEPRAVAEARLDGPTEEGQADWLGQVAEYCSGLAVVPLAGRQDDCLDGLLAGARSALLPAGGLPLPEADWLGLVAKYCSGSAAVPLAGRRDDCLDGLLAGARSALLPAEDSPLLEADWLALVAEYCSGSAVVPLADRRDGSLDGQLVVAHSALLPAADSPLQEADWLVPVAEYCSDSAAVPLAGRRDDLRAAQPCCWHSAAPARVAHSASADRGGSSVAAAWPATRPARFSRELRGARQ